MKQYTVTAKLWITVTVETPEEAEDIAKTTIDEALYYYVSTVNKEAKDMSISKAKVIWAKENK
jgi:hypothetical protein